MPDFITHSLGADRILNNKDVKAGRLFDGCENLFRLGAQGPDILFYCAVAGPLQGLEKIGSELHSADAKQLLNRSLSAYKQGNIKKAAYFAGYSLHLMFDNEAHPFVEKIAKSVSETTDIGEDAAHVRFESSYEALELERNTGLVPGEFDWKKDLALNDEERDIVSLANAEISGIFGLDEIDTKKLSQAQKNWHCFFRFCSTGVA